MKLSDESVKALADIITGDNNKSPYQRKVDIIAFFGKLGGLETWDGETRWRYAKRCLDALNDFYDISQAVIAVLDPRRFINVSSTQQMACDYLNPYFELDGYRIIIENRYPKILELGNAIIKPTTYFEGSEEERHTFIQEQQSKIEQKMVLSDFDGAIASARSMVEAVLRSLNRELTGQELGDKADLPKLYNAVAHELGLDPSRPDLETALKQVLSGLSSIIAGLACVSNRMGDRHSRKYKPDKRHAQLVANSAITVTDFLFETWKARQSDNDTGSTPKLGVMHVNAMSVD